MILLLGDPADTPLAAVRAGLEHQGHRPIIVNLSEGGWRLVHPWDGEREAVFANGDTVADLSSVTAAYLRPDPLGADDIDSGAVLDTFAAWADTAAALVVNRPAAMAPNNSKPLQAKLIRECGFATPATLITTDAALVRKFAREHESIICKSVSGQRSIVWRLTGADDAALEAVRWCPTQFQAYIPGDDYRVHVIGSVLHVTRVVSDADDYRYAALQNSSARMYAAELPDEVTSRTALMVKRMGLSLAGVDLRLSPSDDWWCFEVNPSPAFTFYERQTRQPIADAVAQLLAAPDLGK